MNLDTVELVMAIEEAFGLELHAEDLEKVYTVGQMFELVCAQLQTTQPIECLSQRMFYKIRQGLIDSYCVAREQVVVDVPLQSIVPRGEFKGSWPYLRMFKTIRFPRLEESWWPISANLDPSAVTIRSLIGRILLLHKERLILDPQSREEAWETLCNVIVQHACVSRSQITPNASFTKDLHLD
ncbi:MAG TPA: hypothetical protein V6C72_16610 [Chroococcales cyanobacterium]